MNNPPPTPDPRDLLVHAGFVRGIARAALRGDDSVDDVVQETWLAALSSGPRSAPSARPWLARVTRNISFGVLRRNRRRTAREEATARTGSVPSTAAIAEKEETRRQLLDALLEVREPSRSALVLRYYEDLPPREVAARLGVPVETARTRIKRGLIQLRETLDAKHDGDRKRWALALLPWTTEWAKPASTALGWKLLAGAAATAAVVTVVVRANQPGGDDMGRVAHNVVQVAEPTDAPILVGAANPTEVQPGRSVVFGTITAGSETLTGRVILRTDDRTKAEQVLDGRRFRFEGVVPGTLSIALANEPVVRHGMRLLVDGQHERLDIELPTVARSVSGHATYEDGRPFRGAVHMSGRGKDLLFETSTDKRGHFRFPRAPKGPIRLTALIPDTLQAGRNFEAEATGFDLVVDAGLVPRRGRVVEEGRGKPIAGAFVQVYGTSSTRSGADGRFALPGKKDAYIGVSHPDYPLGVVQEDEDGTRHLRGGGWLLGTVRDASGKPVGAGIRVHAVTQETNFGRRTECRTDEKGRYELAVAPGVVVVYATGDAAASSEIQTWRRGLAPTEAFELRAGARMQRDLGVVATGTLTGTVVNEDDKPLVGALVTVSMQGDVTTPKGLYVHTRHAAADEQGAFRVAGLVPGIPYQATASRYGHAPARTEDVFRVTAGGVASVTLSVDRARKATIAVVNDATDDPVGGIEIKVTTRDGYRVDWSNAQTARTDERGVAHLNGLGTQSLSYRIIANGYVNDANWHPLPDVVGDVEATVRLVPEMTIAGRVHLPDGVPTAKIRIAARGIDGHVMRGSTIPMANATTQADGHFVFRGLHPGPYRLRARTQHAGDLYVGEVVVRQAGNDIELRLTDALPPGAWRVRVRGPDGAPHPTNVMRFSPLGPGEVQGGSVVQFGPLHPNYQEGYLLAAPYVRKETPDGLPGAALLGPFPTEGQDLEVSLPTGRTVQGVVRFPSGQPLANRRLTVTPVLPCETQHMHRFEQVVRTDSLGRYRLRGLGTLAYRVTFQKGVGGWAPDPVQINAEATQHDIVLAEPPDMIRVDVRDAHGDPAGNAWIQVYPKDGTSKPLATTRTRGDGVAKLVGLKRGGSYVVVARTHGKASASYENSAWIAGDTKIDLVAELPFEGVIRTPDGTILRRARLYRRTPMGTWWMLNEHPKKRFQIRLPPGRHFVQAVPAHAAPVQDRGVWVEAGDTNGVIGLDPGPTLRVQLPRSEENVSVSIEREGTPFGKRLFAHADSDGIVEVLGLEADATYVLWASPDRIYGAKDTGRCIFRTGLRADGVLREFNWTASQSVTGRVRVPEGRQANEATVVLHVAGMKQWAQVKSDGTFRLQGTPPGQWRAIATLKTADGEMRAEAETTGAEPVELVLK